jgi:hypothetical protein
VDDCGNTFNIRKYLAPDGRLERAWGEMQVTGEDGPLYDRALFDLPSCL